MAVAKRRMVFFMWESLGFIIYMDKDQTANGYLTLLLQPLYPLVMELVFRSCYAIA
jgi:hypothetical protein